MCVCEWGGGGGVCKLWYGYVSQNFDFLYPFIAGSRQISQLIY